MSSSEEVVVPPPLPLDVRDRVLSHLVPPSIPLPLDLLSKTFIERLRFLPPAEDELDAHLSPFVMAKNALNPNALHLALEQLSGSLKISDTTYAHDGEMTIARTTLSPEYEYGSEPVDTYFENDTDRGWVYRGATLDRTMASHWDWKSHPADVSYVTEETDDYWAGFTPPAEHVQLPDHENEDDYWAQYDAGAEGPAPESRDEQDLEQEPREPEPVTPPAANIPTPDPAATLSLLLHGMGVQHENKIENGDDSAGSESPPRTRSDSVLEQKIRSKVRAALMRAWTEYSAGQDAEASAYEWLRISREISDRPSWGAGAAATVDAGYGDVRSAVVKARIEAAKDIQDVLADQDGFFRLCEEAIRVHSPPMGETEEVPYEYE